MTSTDAETDALPESLRILRQYDCTKQVMRTAQSMPSDFFVRLNTLPGDLLVPGLVFFAIREVSAEVLHIGTTVSGSPAVTGVIDPDRVTPSPEKTIDDVAALPRTVGIHQTDDANLTEFEIVHEQRPGAKLVGSTLARTIESTEYVIVNVQSHGHRRGVSVYLRDPTSDISDCTIEEHKTLADLLTQ